MMKVIARAMRSHLSFCAQAALFIGACSEICTAQTVTTFDVLVATGNLTVVGTTTVQGNTLSVGGSTLAVMGGNVGIGTGTPTAQLHLVGPVVYSSTAQFRWIASKAALRAGEVIGTNWDLSNIGINSIALGFNPLNIQPFGTISGGYSNSMTYGNGTWGVIGGGDSNGIFGFTSDANAGTIGGGQSNRIWNYSLGTIGGGGGNIVYSAGGTIPGGSSNSVGVDGLSNSYATVGGGAYNKAYAYASVIAGGGAIGPAQTVGGNIIDQDATGAAILGGANNNAKKRYATIGGGAFNVAGGAYATVIGGYNNSASGDYSFAAGSAAVAGARGSFVWADSQNQQLISNTTDEFRIRAGGGFVLLSSPTLSTIIVSSGSLLISTSATAAKAVPNIFISSINGYVGIGKDSPAAALDVNGAATASSATLTATGSNIYSLTTSSGIHILAGGITWADGSTSSTALVGGGGSSVVQSTTVYMDTGQSLGSAVWPPCFTNSTATLTGVTSSCVLVLASGSWLLYSAGYNHGLALIVNGALVAGTDNSQRSHGQVWEQPAGGGYIYSFNIAERVCGLTSSTVNVCLTGSTESSAVLAGTSGSYTARKPTLSIIEVRQ